MFMDWTVLFWTEWIPQFEEFVFDDEFGVSWTFDISSVFVDWTVLVWVAEIPRFEEFVFDN